MKKIILLFTLILLHHLSFAINLKGQLDVALTKTNGCTGWVIDQDNPDESIEIQFYIKNQFMGSTFTNISDIDGDKHRFNFTIPEEYRNSEGTLSAWAINTESGNNLKLNNGEQVIGLIQDLTYSNYSDHLPSKPLTLDVIARNGNDKKPLIIFIHGGGFSDGSKELMWEEATAFGRNGDYVTASINYRLFGDTDGKSGVDESFGLMCKNEKASPISWYWAIQDLNAAIKYLL